MKDFCETILLILAIPAYLFLDCVGAHKTAMKIWCWAYDTLEAPQRDDAVYVEDIENSPIIDATVVVHGHWIKHEYAEEANGYLIPNYECSNCHSWLRDNRDYCGDCGAKMDKYQEKL